MKNIYNFPFAALLALIGCSVSAANGNVGIAVFTGGAFIWVVVWTPRDR